MDSSASSRRRLLAAAFAAFGMLALAAPAAHADGCDDLARQLKGQIDGLTIGKPGVNLIELEHPAVQRASLGCASRNVTNEIFAATDSRKPSEAFYDFVARAAALVFTIPKSDALNGTTRCVKRIGIFRGYTIATRYRRLDIRCTGGKAGTTVSISREKDA
jgi:hypothetical protein